MKPPAQKALSDVLARRPELRPNESQIIQAFQIILDSQLNGGELLVCGNGGSAADSVHIVGELLKSFTHPRPIEPSVAVALEQVCPEHGKSLAGKLQRPVRARSLVNELSLLTAAINDTGAEVMFAQQVLAARPGDVLLAISTSGNSRNVVNAAIVAKAIGVKIVGLTGPSGGKLEQFADCMILAPGANTPEVQESHLSIYHALCLMLEWELFD